MHRAAGCKVVQAKTRPATLRAVPVESRTRLVSNGTTFAGPEIAG
jgi:hypothetical protein